MLSGRRDRFRSPLIPVRLRPTGLLSALEWAAWLVVVLAITITTIGAIRFGLTPFLWIPLVTSVLSAWIANLIHERNLP